jgi:hypothetical protein
VHILFAAALSIGLKNVWTGVALAVWGLENESAVAPRFDDLQPLRSLPVIK